MTQPDAHAAFAAALLDPDAPLPAGIATQPGASPAARYSVYRNNVIVGLVDALRARFPVTLRLVGEEFFHAMAREFARAHPPQDPVLMRYGDALPDYIETFLPAQSLPYLADVGRLEIAWSEAWSAAEAPVLHAADLQGHTPEELLSSRVSLHPALRGLRSAYPVGSLWSAHQGTGEPVAPGTWEGESVLVTRPDADVQLRLLPAGALTAVSALADGASLQDAFAMALDENPRLDPGDLLGLLLQAGAITALEPQTP
jgi:hypothetical protein